MIQNKFYSKKDKRFHVIIDNGHEQKDNVFKTFEDFARFLNNDLSNANLYDFDFKGINLEKYNIEETSVDSAFLREKRQSDSLFYNENVKKYDVQLKIMNPFAISKTNNRDLLIEEFDYLCSENIMCISYISDLHLDHKIKKKFPKFASKQEITEYIKLIIKKLENDYRKTVSSVLLIGGDVSFNFEISKIFYRELKKTFQGDNIIVVLGNHELWDSKLYYKGKNNKKKNVQKVIDKYKELLKKFNIIVLENELLIGKRSGSFNRFDFEILSEEQLHSISKEELNEKCFKSILTIFGGLGFSGYDSKYNANMGIYREAVPNLNDDLYYTQRFENLYYKLKNEITNNKLIVLSHTPKSNWSKDGYKNNWIYVNGHTHQNYFQIDDEKTVYADNQIGYKNTSIGLKHFYLSRSYDTLSEYENGIHVITREEYLDFYRGYNISINYNRENIQIYFLKNNGVYCFIQKNLMNGKLSILKGGAPKNLVGSNDLTYYYDNLEYYAKSIDYFLSEYNEKLKEISMNIKVFGGSGRIHGSIVDIDYFNHLYLNPFDGKIIPYYANSTTDKYVYSNVPSLLFYKRKNLYHKYKKLIDDPQKRNQLMTLSGDFEISPKKHFTSETNMYKFSRIVKGLQFITKMRVVRIWNDELLKKKDDLDRSKTLFIDLIKSE